MEILNEHPIYPSEDLQQETIQTALEQILNILEDEDAG